MIKSFAIVLAILFSTAAWTGPAFACSTSADGKYSGYVLRIYVPEDARQYGRCNDYGPWNGSAYKGHRVPAGSFWVYKYPYWYVWRTRGYRIHRGGGRVYWIRFSKN